MGIWEGQYQNTTLPWLRLWDAQGNLLLTGYEQAELERQRAETERERAETERQRAETERERADRLAEQLRSLGIEPQARSRAAIPISKGAIAEPARSLHLPTL